MRLLLLFLFLGIFWATTWEAGPGLVLISGRRAVYDYAVRWPFVWPDERWPGG